MKTRLFLSLTFLLGIGFSQAQNLPENPQPGKCYVKCISKDEFKDVTEQVMIKPAYKKLSVVPGTYKTIEEKVMIKEASKKLVYVPATYETVEVPLDANDVNKELSVTPATFAEEIQTIEVAPKSAGWEYKETDCGSANKEDCVVACYVERPATFKDIKVIRLVNDAVVNEKGKKENTGSYKKQVIKTPARVDEVEIPAEYKTIKRKVLDTPTKINEETVPAEYTNITKSVLVKKGGITTWQEIDCNLLEPTLLPILYDLNSAKLTPEAKRIIDTHLYPLLKDNNLSVELMSHTDSRGNDEYNMSLSQERANSVVNYLVSKGIARDRMIAKGYGETRLKNRCSNGVNCTEAEHHQNRRTEFRVLSN